MADPRDADRPKPVSGTTETGRHHLRGEEVRMPASRRHRRRTGESEELQPALDVDAIMAVLGSHAELASVRLRILFSDRSIFFEADPAEAKKGRENELPIHLPGHKGLVLRGALPLKQLGLVAHVIERVVELKTASGVHQQALDAERQRLSLLFEFSEKVCQLAAFDDIVTRLLGDVTRILGAREGTFFALDPRRKDLYIRCHHGSAPDVVHDFRLAIGEGIAGSVAQDNRPRIVNDVTSCPDYVPKSNPIRNIISAPVSIRDRLIGVVNVNDRAEGTKPFTNRDLQLLVSLARLGGVALDNAKLYSEIRTMLLAVIEALTNAIHAKDSFASGHSRRVAFLCTTLGQRLEMGEQERDMLQVAAMLHDIGTIAVSEAVLKKAGPLTPEEQAMIREHPDLGASILSPVRQLSAVLPGVVDHHERYDGRGYPRRLKGDEISLQGRLIAVADAFDAMTHDRPFRKAFVPADALAEITAESGSQFDPALVALFVECYRELELERVPLDQLVPSHPEPEF